jgi:protocatechuate 3,4-dioxygenase, beta subunit
VAGCLPVNCSMLFRRRSLIGPKRRTILKKEAHMCEDHSFSRQRLLKMSLVTGGAAFFGPMRPGHGQSAEIVPTSEQDIGPFYPVTNPLDQDGDLTMVKGRAGKAQGQIVYLSGRVLDLNGKPIPNARVEIWQANTFGRYSHPGDSNPAPLDPDFKGHGVNITNGNGMYRFKTVKPGAYPAAEGRMRPPHVHFLVTAGPDRLVSQMYFPGEPLNETDQLLGSAENKESIIAKVTSASRDDELGALVATWDIVLPRTGE